MKTEKKPNSRFQLLCLLLLNYFSFAFVTNIPGALLPFWKEDFNLSSTVVSFLGSVFFLAYGLTSLPQGVLIDNIGNKKTFIWGAALLLIGSVAFAFKPIYSVGLISLFVLGIGVTALQLVGSLVVKKIDDDPNKYSRNLSLTQVACGIGGAGGGFMIGYLINGLGLQWQSIYYLFAGISLLLAVFVMATNIPENQSESDEFTKNSVKPTMQDYLKLITNPMMLLYAFGIFIYVGIEVGVATWISTYLLSAYNLPKVNGAQVVSLYWIMQSVGRFSGGLVLNYLSSTTALIIYSIGCLASLLLAILSPVALFSTIGFGGVGFFTSIMFPSIFSLAVNSFDKKQEGAVAGILCTAIVGGAVTTPLIGFISDSTGSLAKALIITGVASFLYLAFVGVKASSKKLTTEKNSLQIESRNEVSV